MTLTISVSFKKEKERNNGGDEYMVTRATYTVEKVYMYTCGCSRLPKLVQRANGVAYHNYCGESFHFECECGMRTQAITNNHYHNGKKYKERLGEILTTLILTWNNAMFNNNSSVVKLVCH